jgi:large subunit ribosomal protein L10e
MAKLKKGVAHRRMERPYTRYSKYRNKAFIRTIPALKLVRFDMGNLTKEFDYQVDIIVKAGIQIRQESIESARQATNRYLEKYVGKSNYHMKIRAYPFHILRENPLAQGAGADRFSTGMAHPFGKVVGRAVQIKYGKPLFTIFTNKDNVKQVTMGLQKGNNKLPCSCQIIAAPAKLKQN